MPLNPRKETQKIYKDIANRILEGQGSGICFDSDGIKAGSWKFDEHTGLIVHSESPNLDLGYISSIFNKLDIHLKSISI